MPEDELVDLVVFGIDRGIDSIKQGGPLIPFVVYQIGRERTLERFMAERLEDGLAKAKEAVASRRSDVDRAVIVYDGFLTAEGAKSDAVFGLGYSRIESELHAFAQRYSPRKLLSKFATKGNIAYVGPVSPGDVFEDV